MSGRSYLAVCCPWLLFFTVGRPFSGIACGLLQLTIVGWPVAIVWAISALDKFADGDRGKRKSFNNIRGEFYQASDAEEPAKYGKVEDTKLPELSLASKIIRGTLAIAVMVLLFMAITTSLKEKIRDSITGGCPGMDATRSYWISSSAIDFPYRDFCIDTGASYNPKTDEWIKTIKTKRKGVRIDIVNVKDEFGVPIPFRQIDDPSGTGSKIVLSRHHLGGYRATPIYIEAGKKLPIKKFYDGYDPRYDTKPRSAYTMSRIGVPDGESASGMSSWLPKFTLWQEIIRMLYGWK